MKLTVLLDNNTFIDEYYYGEPAVSYYIEDEGEKILFDVGYSDILLKNASLLGIDLKGITTVVLSHGHDDHTRGLIPLLEQGFYGEVRLIAHEDALKEKLLDGLPIGSPFSEKELSKKLRLELTKGPVDITENLIFLGEIPEINSFETRTPLGTVRKDDLVLPDLLFDDTALVYKSDKGLLIITGCSHSGICNIMEYAKTVCGDERILGAIGGFHLFGVTPRLEQTIQYFKDNNISLLYPCHCVDFPAKAEIHKTIPLREVGVGLVLDQTNMY